MTDSKGKYADYKLAQALDKRAAEICGVSCMEQISRPEIYKAIIRMDRHMTSLMAEIYCNDPKHYMFNTWSKEYRAPYEQERIRRINEKKFRIFVRMYKPLEWRSTW